MILLPLLATAHIVHCNVWSYIAFGATLSSWLALLHCEVSCFPIVSVHRRMRWRWRTIAAYATLSWQVDHPWDPAFRAIGLGTPSDHRAHHRCSLCNYGHLFVWWDVLAGTYRPPVPRA